MRTLLLPVNKMKRIQKLILMAGFVLCIAGCVFVWRETGRMWLRLLSLSGMLLSSVMIVWLAASCLFQSGFSPYAADLKTLESLEASAAAKVERIGVLVSQLFAPGSLTALKFQVVSQEVLTNLREDVRQARRAADAFGNEPADAGRQAVFDQYIETSRETLARLDHLLLLLVHFDKDRDKAVYESALSLLNESMDSLRLYK